MTQMSTNWWVDKQIVAYPYNGILFSNKKEQCTDTCYNMTGYQKLMLNERW